MIAFICTISTVLTDHFRVRQTFLGQKFWPPNFFLKTHSPYAQRLGAVKIFHPRTPLGPQNPYLGVRPPQNRIIAYFARKNYLPFSRSCRTLINLHTIPKQMDPTFFGSIFDLKTPKKRQKRAKFEKGKKEGPYGSIFDLTSISKPKILEFYHTLRKTWQIDV